MQIVELILLAAIWGASFLFMRIGAPEFGPIALIFLRVGIATLVLLPVVRSKVARQQLRSRAWPLLVVGVFGSAIPFCLFAYSTLYINAGFDSILNATTPLWTALIAMIWLKIPLDRSQVLGLLVGLVGVIILVWDKIGDGLPEVWLAIGAVLLATLSYGFAANYSKQRLAGIPPFVVALGSQFFATVVLLPFALFYWPAGSISLSAWSALLALGVVCTGFAFVIYFRLIENVSAAYATSVTFLIPIFGVLWGALFLSEAVSLNMIVGSVVILLGTALGSGKVKFSSVRVSGP
ncbi:DMT family transporter [Glaciimonas immobilis]|uniref:Drug/metabolite transporter (DMT)-like permease n=1 Tax=Glaciimonas immobilis TaxID=728004 RepID=A0A840RY25_9BURK|nr:DMT family transporter [Glaciimonas immobilis]KAF3998506.1 DMT family transporter [Glaciimonas immobilis]MBB5201350.1 drug/metabolite transporter (DMT)-like permease [Glaciimonas immobilis]